MRHTGLTFRSLRGSCLRCEISQKLGPRTAAFSAGNCSWGFSSELWMGFTVGPERRVQSKVPQGLTAAGSPGFFSSLFTGTHWHCLCLSGASDFLFQDRSQTRRETSPPALSRNAHARTKISYESFPAWSAGLGLSHCPGFPHLAGLLLPEARAERAVSPR